MELAPCHLEMKLPQREFNFFRTTAVLALAIGITVPAGAQNPPATRSQISGTVTSVNASGNQISLKSDKGDAIEASTTDRTLILRIPPGETDPKKGTKIPLASLSAGDRAVIVGTAPASGSAWNATAVLVMTSGDLASLRQKDQDDWKQRGVTGTVTAVDPAAKSVTVKSGSHTYTVQSSPTTTWAHYSPDSARFADAKPSSFDEVKSGDQLRVLGNKSEDGSSIRAEKIVFGTFRQIAATVSSIDAAKGELTVRDLATKKPLVIKVESDSTMRRLPEQMARMLARRYAPGGGQSQAAPPAAPAGAGAGRGGNGDVGQMLDRLPALTIAELKPGDALMVSTTQGSDPGRVSAIMLLAGVEPLLTASPSATRDIMSGWNLGGGGGEGGQ